MMVVVGGGPAGRIAAMRLAEEGQEVCLVDSGGLGGQCLHFGCMVVCALNDVARHRRQAETLAGLGIVDTVPGVSFGTLLKEMASIQATIHGILREETKQAGVTVLAEREARVDGRTVTAGRETFRPEAVLVATGSAPYVPEIEGIGLPGIYTPHTLHTMPDLPETVAILGGGVMAAEFAYIFGGLGSRVEMICRSGFLPNIDPKLRETARKDIAFATIRENTAVDEFRGTGKVQTAELRSGDGREEIDVDAVFVAAGLVPRTEAVSGLEKGPLGEIRVDASMRTSVSGVWAAGDVTGPPYLTPVARREGLVAAESMLGRERTIDRAWIPQSMSLGYDYAFSSMPAEPDVSISIPAPAGPGTFWSVPARHTGMAKIRFQPDGGGITGIYAAAPGASLSATYLAFLMRQGATIHDFRDLLEVHPSTDGIYWLLQHSADWVRRHRP
ncbi:MAG: hypothetical protein APR53_10520 [Methanoculleus sp. SDB]|nr:MAG: hypothetical protein APR53_10520 [Methanoculleus sp. SDB]